MRLLWVCIYTATWREPPASTSRRGTARSSAFGTKRPDFVLFFGFGASGRAPARASRSALSSPQRRVDRRFYDEEAVKHAEADGIRNQLRLASAGRIRLEAPRFDPCAAAGRFCWCNYPAMAPSLRGAAALLLCLAPPACSLRPPAHHSRRRRAVVVSDTYSVTLVGPDGAPPASIPLLNLHDCSRARPPGTPRRFHGANRVGWRFPRTRRRIGPEERRTAGPRAAPQRPGLRRRRGGAAARRVRASSTRLVRGTAPPTMPPPDLKTPRRRRDPGTPPTTPASTPPTTPASPRRRAALVPVRRRRLHRRRGRGGGLRAARVVPLRRVHRLPRTGDVRQNRARRPVDARRRRAGRRLRVHVRRVRPPARELPATHRGAAAAATRIFL